MKLKFYTLVNKVPVLLEDEAGTPAFEKAITLLRDLDRKVAVTQIGPVKVSTVFLMLDYSFDEKGEPILFETMTFYGNNDEYSNEKQICQRYKTWEEAEAGHAEVVKRIEAELGAIHSQN